MKSNGTQSGFSLVELLVVVIIIAVIAAIAIPSLLASRRAANEASAVASMRSIHSAEVAFLNVYGNNSSFGDLSELGSVGLLDPLLGGADTVSKSGYTFSISRPASAPYLIYCATGFADTFGSTGSRDFAVSTPGVVYATPTDGDMSCTDGVLDTGSGGTPIQ